jgi:hypothetical protein
MLSVMNFITNKAGRWLTLVIKFLIYRLCDYIKMTTQINLRLASGESDIALQACAAAGYNHLGLLLSRMLNTGTPRYHQLCGEFLGARSQPSVAPQDIGDQPIRVKLLCNWMSSRALCELWNKMSKGNYTWNNIQIVWTDVPEPDYYVIINATQDTQQWVNSSSSKVILFQMEPHMAKRPEVWGAWAKPNPTDFLFCGTYDQHYNNNEWHLSKTYNELMEMEIVKTEAVATVLSTVLSAKYSDPGHMKRIDFVKFLEGKGMCVHVFGNNKFKYVNYKGIPPSHCKDEAMFPYKYAFNCENNQVKNYYTEKLIDGILAECLVFYSGCFNVKEYIDPRAFVYLELSNFEDDYARIQEAIKDNLWEKRLPYIKAAKRKILTELQFFPRLERIINESRQNLLMS